MAVTLSTRGKGAHGDLIGVDYEGFTTSVGFSEGDFRTSPLPFWSTGRSPRLSSSSSSRNHCSSASSASLSALLISSSLKMSDGINQSEKNYFGPDRQPNDMTD